MPNFSKLFQTNESQPFRVGDQTLILVSRSLHSNPPEGLGGLIWNRPVAIKVRTASGVEHILPVIDETRQRQVAILALGLTGAILIGLLFGRRS